MSSATPSNQKTIVLMVEVLPADARGNRKIIVSGAPKEEMPLVRAGLFANRHALLDEIYRDVMKRKPQVIKRAASATAKREDAKDEPEPETTTEQGDTPETELDDAAAEQFAQAVSNAKNEIESGHPGEEPAPADGTAWKQDALPLIENDPTQSEAAHG